MNDQISRRCFNCAFWIQINMTKGACEQHEKITDHFHQCNKFKEKKKENE